MRRLLIIAAVATLLSPRFVGIGQATAAVVMTTTAPTIDGVISLGEWDAASVEFDSGPRPSTGSGWDLAGAKGRFLWDSTNVYGVLEAYPNTGGVGANPNGPFDNMNWEVYINAVGFPAAIFMDTTGGDPNNVLGSTAAFGTVDPVSGLARMVLEFQVPIASIVDTTGGTLPNPHTFDPSGGDFLEYRIRTTDPDAAGGFDTRDQTLGWITEPLETGGGFRRLDFATAQTVIPEPASLIIWSVLAGGAAGLAVRRKRRALASPGRWSQDRREAILAVIDRAT